MEVPAPVILRREFPTIPPVTVSPPVERSPLAERDPEIEEVAVVPVTLNGLPLISSPPEKLEVAEDVTAREVVVAFVALSVVRVVEPRMAEIVVPRIFPPVIVSPLLEEIPTVATPCKVEEAVVEVAKKLLADTPPANVPAP